MPITIIVSGIASDMDGTLVDSSEFLSSFLPLSPESQNEKRHLLTYSPPSPSSHLPNATVPLLFVPWPTLLLLLLIASLSAPAVEKTMTDFCLTNEIDPVYFFSHSHGVRTRDNIKRFMKGGADLSEEELIKQVNILETSIAENGRLLASQGKRGISQLPGVHSLLKKLKEGGARYGIVTSATLAYASAALNASGIERDSLPFLITSETCTMGKPHPEPYLRGITALQSLPGPPILASDVLVLEDAPAGIQSGLAAGCRTLAVCTGQSRETIRAIEATYKVVDLERVEVLEIKDGLITLRLTTLEEEEEAELKAAVVQ